MFAAVRISWRWSLTAVRESECGLSNTKTAVVGRKSHCDAFCPRSGQSQSKNPHSAHVKGWNKRICVQKSPLSVFKEFHTLFNLPSCISVTCPQRLGGFGNRAPGPRCPLWIGRAPGEAEGRLCWAASRSHHQPVQTHCDKDMHSWGREAVFAARISCLCQECCCSLRSNFFPWVKVRNGFQPELRRDCQLHWSQETSPHPPAPWLLTLTALSLPSSLKSWNFITSAIMKPFSKSVWIFPAACGALVPFCHREGKERTNELFWRRWITACRRQGVWWGRYCWEHHSRVFSVGGIHASLLISG